MYFFGKFGKLSLKHMQKRLETQPPPQVYTNYCKAHWLFS